ncbi:dicarboxylate/amino acid:cation symporter [Ferrimonas balearica]|uniref:dicarboxylate/amino acid:cation symporter n=1 Tax=Ferrimonas balearica TaxID=44012 RepID=UPI001C9A12A5|nr:dicarboxylate/amino acid:cation symporter [Ferrimonas balearica]MBY5922915.1 dicarboxylate/amino acid:cation symporter [Ferrimonas balearica]MBY5997708.1 dicarboxylate/amino acid:cation symporter [Ferrimonas balearica]
MQSTSLSKKIFTGLFSGLLIGVVIQAFLADLPFFNDTVVGLASMAGSMFVNLIMMLVVPLVFVSIISGITELPNANSLGRLGGKTFGLYLINTLVAISVALAIALILQPGRGADLPHVGDLAITATELPSISGLIMDIIPRNPIEAFASGNMLQIIFMALLLGFVIKLLGKEMEGVAEGFRKANTIMMTLITLVMKLAPYGVFGLMVNLGATLEASTFLSVAGYIGLIVSLLIVWLFVVYPMAVGAFTNISAAEFRRQTREQVMFSLSCASSNATIPVTMRTLTQKLGVSKATAGFGVPLGATMNMGGVSIYITIAAVFLANAFDVPLGMEQLPALVASVFLLSVGAGGVPGGGAVMIGVLIHQMGLPAETAFALVIAVDRIIDMFVTSANVVGDAAVVTIVDKSEAKFAEAEAQQQAS